MAETIKKRNWAFVLYPESAPEDWREQIKISGLMAAVSPLHDKDVNPTGEPKKAHYHILLVYSGPTTYNAVAKFTASLNATIPQALESVRGMYRYFSHKDNPEKYQYDESEIFTLNGFNIADLVELTKSEVNELKMKILKLIRDVDITEYSGLVDFLIDNEMMAEYDVAINNTFFFHTYVTSRRNSQREEAENLSKIELARLKACRIAKREAEKENDEKCDVTITVID
jgi:hypothetical protein